MKKDIEEWKEITGHNGDYLVSTFGRIKSLKRKHELILSPGLNTGGYLIVGLSCNGTQITQLVHMIVAKEFLNHIPTITNLVIDHKDNQKLNNRKDNLQLITQRENTSKDRVGASKYTGVSYVKVNGKWLANCTYQGKTKHIGQFTYEYDAHLAYQNFINNIV